MNIRNIAKSALFIAIVMAGLLSSCRGGHGKTGADEVDTIGRLPDTLRVGTLYSPTSYFIFKEEKMGYDYDMVNRFVSDKGLVLDLKVATSLNSMIAMLDSGQIDLVAYEVPITAEYKQKVKYRIIPYIW